MLRYTNTHTTNTLFENEEMGSIKNYGTRCRDGIGQVRQVIQRLHKCSIIHRSRGWWGRVREEIKLSRRIVRL